MVSAAAQERAEMLALAREIIGKVKQEEIREKRILETYFKQLKKIYKNKTPKEVITSKAQGKRIGKSLHGFFRGIRKRILRHIRAELADDARLVKFFRDKADENAKRRVMQVQDNQEKIRTELKHLVAYWAFVEKNGTLPGGWRYNLRQFNDRMIRYPLTAILRDDVLLLEQALNYIVEKERESAKS